MTDAALPILSPTAQIPTAVRNGGEQRMKDFRSELSFEKSLIVEMTKQLTKTTKLSDDDEETQDAATKSYRDQLPTILADALVSTGGIGIASTLDASLHQEPKAGRPSRP